MQELKLVGTYRSGRIRRMLLVSGVDSECGGVVAVAAAGKERRARGSHRPLGQRHLVQMLESKPAHG
jgi:hypothetical protein